MKKALAGVRPHLKVTDPPYGLATIRPGAAASARWWQEVFALFPAMSPMSGTARQRRLQQQAKHPPRQAGGDHPRRSQKPADGAGPGRGVRGGGQRGDQSPPARRCRLQNGHEGGAWRSPADDRRIRRGDRRGCAPPTCRRGSTQASRHEALEAKLSDDATTPVRLHPKTWRWPNAPRWADLAAALGDPTIRDEAVGILRRLV